MWPFSTLIRDSAPPEARDNGWTAFLDNVTPVASGVSVSEDNAVNLPAVYKCWSLNSETVSSLPIDVFAKRGDTRVPYPEPAWMRQPNERQTMPDLIAMTSVSVDASGNGYWLKVSDDAGHLVGLELIPSSACEPRLVDGQLVYFIMTSEGRKPYPSNAIVHLRGLTLPGSLVGLSPIACAKQTIGIALAAEEFGGRYFGSGIHPSGIIEVPTALNPEQTEILKAQFTKRHGGISQSHALGVISGGGTFKPIAVTMEDSQFLQSRRYSAGEIANLYGIPVEFVGDGSTDGAKGYVTGVSMRFRMWYLTGLLPRITRIERALSSLLPRPAYVRLGVNGLLRMEPTERTAFYQAAQLGEWMTRNEIRALEEMDPMEGGDEPLHSVQWQENSPEPAPAGFDVQEDE